MKPRQLESDTKSNIPTKQYRAETAKAHLQMATCAVHAGVQQLIMSRKVLAEQANMVQDGTETIRLDNIQAFSFMQCGGRVTRIETESVLTRSNVSFPECRITVPQSPPAAARLRFCKSDSPKSRAIHASRLLDRGKLKYISKSKTTSQS
jgi:hypothetical protein